MTINQALPSSFSVVADRDYMALFGQKKRRNVGIGTQQHQSLDHQLHRVSSGFHCG